MKNILVSVDFSKNAQVLALHVAELAQQSKSRLILLHVYQPDALCDLSDPAGKYNERFVQEHLDRLARKLHKETGISVTRLMKPGSNPSETIDVAKAVWADVAIICDAQQECASAVTVYSQGDLPILNVPSSTPFAFHTLLAQVTEELQALGYTSNPLPEAI